MKLEMTNQEIFDIVYKGLRSQKFERSMLSDGETCAYRGCNGKCAAGWIIPDELYKEEYEGNIIYNVIELSNFLGNKVNFINRLQEIHDESEEPHIMKNKLKEFAEQYDLRIPE